MKRVAPEEHFRDDAPLFARDAAWNRAETGMARAAAKAQRVEPAWREQALATLRAYCVAHPEFLAEDVGISVPEEADPRAAGGLFLEAKRRGWLVANGAAPANSSNRSFKTLWRSLIHEGPR